MVAAALQVVAAAVMYTAAHDAALNAAVGIALLKVAVAAALIVAEEGTETIG